MSQANAITLTASLTVNNPSATGENPTGMSFTDLQFNQTANTVIGPTSMAVPTSATPVPLGPVTTPHWAVFRNLDPTNFITIFNGANGAVLLRLLGASAGAGPYGDVAIIPLDPNCVPYAKSDTAICQMTYMIAGA